MSDERLDEETERLIRDVAVEWDGRRKPPFVPASVSIPALRQRIRELTEEARSNAVVDCLKDKNFIIGESPEIADAFGGVPR